MNDQLQLAELKKQLQALDAAEVTKVILANDKLVDKLRQVSRKVKKNELASSDR